MELVAEYHHAWNAKQVRVVRIGCRQQEAMTVSDAVEACLLDRDRHVRPGPNMGLWRRMIVLSPRGIC